MLQNRSFVAYEKMKLDNEIYIKLKEAEIEAQSSKIRYLAKAVFADIQADLDNYLKADE